MDERKLKAFELANESAKQLVTLAVAILALTITLVKEVGTLLDIVRVAWVLYLVSIAAGVWRLDALASELERSEGDHQPSTRARMVRIPTVLHVLSFVAASAMLVYYGMVVI
ncbi:hypothetical protein KIPE111705_32440 [Kibdelosporangium persicum]|uniref:Uncharacterized protein n=1 Tax=Kibdelosporangium persicum TaxID=2698649 RepID=A0ABX2FJZ5_9PSEU|nr:hypothetical protein [Kibdelosporangium persicum]NRN71116.1 hypothetical protein [Kibdelosporangium persicum]